ncbi:MAG: hypothetical protein M3R66_10760 [Actinomycetota bacterium]|nr:hypothetical protein [Actinomycetota bacterium]
MTKPALTVLDDGRLLAFTFEDLLRYHGGGSPGGVAQAFKVLERALPLLSPDGPAERREISLRTPFGGPGFRDAVEMVTRAVTGSRYVVDPELLRPDLGRNREQFVFHITYRGRTVTLLIRDGLVRDDFIDLLRNENRTSEDDAHFETLKQDFADRLMAGSAEDAYDVEEQA